MSVEEITDFPFEYVSGSFLLPPWGQLGRTVLCWVSVINAGGADAYTRTFVYRRKSRNEACWFSTATWTSAQSSVRARIV